MKFTKRIYLFFYIGILFCACKTEKKHAFILSPAIQDTLKKQSKIALKNWHFKDIEIDTIPGISLERAYDSLLIDKKGKEVIIAVIDMPIEISHAGLVNYIWTNKKEIANNQIDDDKNGYIDDIHGWNFLNNLKGENNDFVNYEYTRIIRKFNSRFDKKTIEEIEHKDTVLFKIYKRARTLSKKRQEYAIEDLDYITNVSKWKNEAEKTIAIYLKKEKYVLNDLDSLKKIFPKNKKLQDAILKKSNFINWEYTDTYIDDYKLKAEERINKLLNINYNDREVQSDNPENINNIKYGSPNFNVNTKLLDHGTKMAGIIASASLGREIKIMPLAISAFGDEHDKDIALAIRYAVDNGAKVINMSFSKQLSLNPKWVLEAIKYANSKNVLMVNGAANDGQDIDDELNNRFPNDHNYFNIIEVSDNFLRVGSNGIYTDKNLKSSFSNYGKNEVDLFAPGEYIFTTFPNNNFDLIYGGTSASSALTSAVAGLIFSYYPNLTASQVKHILMDAGLEYTLEVNTPTEEDKNKTMPFNQLRPLQGST
jgi:subtilisin family serine protease